MYIGLFGAVKGLFTSKSKKAEQLAIDGESEEHAYVRGDITGRGPCPALNSLANQGYLYVQSFEVSSKFRY
jgi:hypothetical protein